MKHKTNKTSKLVASILAVAMIAIMAGCGGGGNTGNANSGNANAGNASSTANNQGGAVAQAASQAAAKPAAQSAAKPSSSLSLDEKYRLEELERYKAYVKTINANPAECSAYDYSFTEKGAEELFDYIKNVKETKSAKYNAALSIVSGMSNKKEGIFYFTKNYADVTDMLNKYFESEQGQQLCKGWGDAAAKNKNKVINMINNVAKDENSNVWFILVPGEAATYEFMVFLENGNVFRSNSTTTLQGLFGLPKDLEEEKMHKQYAQYFVDDNGKIDLKNFG